MKIASTSLLLCALFSVCATAQGESGIYGVVRAQSSGGGNEGRGELTDPIAGAVVTALDAGGEIVARAVSDQGGAYRLEVPDGSYRLSAVHSDFESFDTKEVILLVQAGHFTLFNISLSSRIVESIGVLGGTVIDRDSLPVEGALVTALDPQGGGASVGSVLTGEAGRFRIELPAGVYEVNAARADYDAGETLTVEIQSGASAEITITLEGGPEPAGGLQGLFRARGAGAAAGRPIPDVDVSVVSENERITRSTKTNQIGFYKLNLPPGRYRLSARHSDFEPLDSGKALLDVDSEQILTWNGLLKPLTPISGPETCRERLPVSVGSSYGERHSIYIKVRFPGVFTVSYRWTGNAPSLALILKGPDGSVRRVDGSSQLNIVVEVGADATARGSQWEVTIANFSGGSAQGTLSVRYPCEK